MSEDYMLTTEDVEESFACGNRSIVAMDIREENSRNIGLFREWLAAHDREVRREYGEQVSDLVQRISIAPYLAPRAISLLESMRERAASIARGEGSE